MQFVLPPGGRTYVLTVPVILDRPWYDAVRPAGPNTPDNYNVWKVGELYPPTGTNTKESEVILVNFGPSPNGGSLTEAIAWAKQYGLKLTNPRQVFAIGEHKPQLNRELKMDPMYVVSTQECSFRGRQQVCDVWWDGAKRLVALRWTVSLGYSDVWFAFVRE